MVPRQGHVLHRREKWNSPAADREYAGHAALFRGPLRRFRGATGGIRITVSRAPFPSKLESTAGDGREVKEERDGRSNRFRKRSRFPEITTSLPTTPRTNCWTSIAITCFYVIKQIRHLSARALGIGRV